MKYVRTQIGDALRRIWTYGFGGQLDYKQTAPSSTAIQNLWIKMFIIGNPFFSFRAMLGRYLVLWLCLQKKRSIWFGRNSKSIRFIIDIVQILRGRTQPPVVAEAKETDAQVLITQLLSGERRGCITWIVGIRGTGKTTLAKLIFQDSGVVRHFDCQVWVSVTSTSLRTYYKDVLSFMSFDPQEGSKPGQQIGSFLKGCISSDCFLLLRVLDLERVYKPKLPKRIARLNRLRYLGLRCTYLESLPLSISNLLKLQTLDLKHTYIHTLPTSIWKMELRHLHLFLNETYGTRFPPQPDLQTLSGLFVDAESSVQGNIKKLGLACQSMSLLQEDEMKKQLVAVADWITKLEHLQSLRLKSRDEQGKPWILHLNSLDDPMTLLKDFPNLLAESYIGTTMVCESQSFPQLRVLKLWVLEQFDEWIIEPGALPCPRQRLKMLPDGLKHVNTLLELKLTNMPTEIKADGM
ncbi:unnamed protein product [Vicia faba]|uniref:NB-ARC domain-containing protein n=1 Tax=Vicia faba TaxID=3906 RepID=A0AAV1A0F8_VICFA|nr:unnamed protein product [Vicia faba]